MITTDNTNVKLRITSLTSSTDEKFDAFVVEHALPVPRFIR